MPCALRLPHHFFAAALLTGCVSNAPVPDSQIPVTIEQTSIFASSHASVYSQDGMLSVSGRLALSPARQLPWDYSVHLRLIGLDGRLLMEVSARPDVMRHRGDMRAQATFDAKTTIPVNQVARVEVTFED